MVHAIQQGDHITTIAGTATHACLRGNAFIEMGVQTWERGEVLFQQLIGAHHEVALFVAVDVDVRHFQTITREAPNYSQGL